MSQTPIVIVEGAWLLFAMSQTPNVTVRGVVIVIYNVTITGCHVISLAIVYRILLLFFMTTSQTPSSLCQGLIVID